MASVAPLRIALDEGVAPPRSLLAKAFSGGGRWRRGLLSLAVIGLGAWSIGANAATSIPLPEPLVLFHTVSGSVTRDIPVPIGGVPIPIDVDNGLLLGLLSPDVDVSVGLIAADQLPGKPIVPNIVIARDGLAIVRHAPAPPLKIDGTVAIDDVANNLHRIATVKYGYQTPPGQGVPPNVTAELLGPITGGFVNPLEAQITSPGYDGPLTINVSALTDTLAANFSLNYDPLPAKVHFIYTPRSDGLDAHYDESGPIQDIHLQASADLQSAGADLLHIGAGVERMPAAIDLHYTGKPGSTAVEYLDTPVTGLAKPDVTADYVDKTAAGSVVTNAHLQLQGLPNHLTGLITQTPDGNGGSQIQSVALNILDGQELDAADIWACNYDGGPFCKAVGPGASLPVPQLQPTQYVAAATRNVGGTMRFRAAARLRDVRALAFQRVGTHNDGVDVNTDLGGGTLPLHAVVDLDNRGTGAPIDAQRMAIDATITPLPSTIHARFEPGTGAEDTHLLYESPQSVDADVSAEIDAKAGNGCGTAFVTCLSARVDKVPSTLAVTLPGTGGTDFSLSSNPGTAGTHPDVHAIVDRATIDDTTHKYSRAYADVRLLRVPPEVRGRLDTSALGVLKTAEFHACPYDFTTASCPTGTQNALGAVIFTVRDQPDRGNLPPVPDTTKDFVSLISRDNGVDPKHFEATGRVDEVRNVAFHQRDLNNDGKADGTLGVLVDAGTGADPFQAVVDTIAPVTSTDTTDTGLIGSPVSTNVNVKVSPLPSQFSACVRSPDDNHAPPDPSTLLPADSLLAPCDAVNVLGRTATNPLTVTPLSLFYSAKNKPDITASFKTTGLKREDPSQPPIQHTTAFNATINQLPDTLRADVITPITPDPSKGIADRKMEIGYVAHDPVPKIVAHLQSSRSNSLCSDPRVNRLSTCLDATITNLPRTLSITQDPDETKGDLTFDATRNSGDPSPSIDPISIATVSPNPDNPTTGPSKTLSLTAGIDDITDHIKGKIVNLHQPDDAPGKTSLASLDINACPTSDPCDGIGKITFTATNSLVGDILPPVPAGDAGVNQNFSFVQEGDDFRAQGTITKLKEIGFSKLDGPSNAQTLSPATTMRAAFGNGDGTDKLRAYLLRDTTDPVSGTDNHQLVDAYLSKVPKALNICFRPALDTGTPAPATNDFNFCDQAPVDKLAIQAKLDQAATGSGAVKPDIDIRRLEMGVNGASNQLQGPPGPEPATDNPNGSAVRVFGLGERVDALVGDGSTTNGKPDVLVVGHHINDSSTDPPQDVADRVAFDVRTFKGDPLPGAPFPFSPLTPYNGSDHVDPAADSRDLDATDNVHNFVKVQTDGGTGRTMLQGSIPDIKLLQLSPNPCNPTDPRYPAGSLYSDDPSQQPAYTCVHANVAQNRKLGFAVRSLSPGKATASGDDNQITSIEDGLLDSVPGGGDGLKITLASTPDSLKNFGVCAPPTSVAPTCRPPILSADAPKASGQTSNLQASLAMGPNSVLNALNLIKPEDEISNNLNYLQPPKNWPQKGARLKLGTSQQGTAVTAGLNLDLPNFLDFDPPVLYSCGRQNNDGIDYSQDDPKCAYDAGGFGQENSGFKAQDIAIRLVGADDAHYGTALNGDPHGGYLGRAAVLIQDFGKTDPNTGKVTAPSQTILTGTPAEPGDGDPRDELPEALPSSTSDDNLGLQLPNHLQANVYIREQDQAPGDDDQKGTYYQVDGRVSQPLSLSLRAEEAKNLDNLSVLGQTFSGHTIPSLMLDLRNAPGVADSDLNYTLPTFRMRAMTRDKHTDTSVQQAKCNGFNAGGGRTAGFGLDFCLFTPGRGITKYTYVSLNAKPNDGEAAARTIDAVVDGTDNTKVDLRGFANVVDTPDTDPGATSNIRPIAALREQPFILGLEAGAGIGIVGGDLTALLQGDLLLRAGSPNSLNEMNIGQNKTAIELAAHGADGAASKVRTYLQENDHIVTEEDALFGLISSTQTYDSGPYDQDIIFNACAFPAIGIFAPNTNQFTVTADGSGSGDHKAGIVLDPLSAVGHGSITGTVFGAISQLLSPIACAFFGTNVDTMVDASNPKPFYEEPGAEHTIPGISGTSTPVPVSPPPPPPQTLHVLNGQHPVLCGSNRYSSIEVDSGGSITAGVDGTTSNQPGFDNSGNPITVAVPCDGTLTLDADTIIVHSGGSISATGAMGHGDAGDGNIGTNGGGAGNGGQGGSGGLGSSVGGAAGGNANDVLHDRGTGGSDGPGGGAGGEGGGSLKLIAGTSISIDGTVAADGQAGHDVGGTNCANSGGGGGSAGAINLTANRIDVSNSTGSVEANGGNGGSGPNGGGGGGGGRLNINHVVGGTPAGRLHVNKGNGHAKTGGASCNNGNDGANGDPNRGVTLSRAATVTRDDPNPFVRTTVDLNLTALQSGGGSLDVVVCRKTVPLSGHNIGDAALDPSSGSTTPQALISDASACQLQSFSGPDANPPSGDTYTATVHETGLSGSGYYGFYAFAVHSDGANCLNDPTNGDCHWQQILPTGATVRVQSDTTPPSLNVAGLNGKPGCVHGATLHDALCVTSSPGQLQTSGAAPGGLDVSSVTCSDNGGPSFSCGPGVVAIPLTEGENDISVTLTDTSGITVQKTIAWFLDSNAPAKPSIPPLSFPATDPIHNGWHKVPPSLTVIGSDTNPSQSSGFNENPIKVFVDGSTDPAKFGSANSCGGGATDSAGPITCLPADTANFVPASGKHTFSATMTDRAGNSSPDPTPADEQTMQVDDAPPISKLLIGPSSPDGSDNWYVSTPFFTFAARDTAGGSGVDPDDFTDSGVFYSIDGGPVERFEHESVGAPASYHDHMLRDGTHTICWHAVDVSGRAETDRCQTAIKVDTQVPTTSTTISPASPNGTNSWYSSRPSVTPVTADATPGSGLVLSQYRIDDGDWTNVSGPVLMPEGDHTIFVRAFDDAGNAATVAQREVRVDLSAPSSDNAIFATPNTRGWNRMPAQIAIGVQDGRDGSGADVARVSTDGGAAAAYLEPLSIGEGNHTLKIQPFDRAGIGGPVTTLPVRVDLTPPVATPSNTAPLPVLISLLGIFSPTPLNFTVTDNLSPTVRVAVEVYDTLNNVVRRMVMPGDADGYRPTGAMSVSWNGLDGNGHGVLSGVYHFRVEAIDQAGNTIVSTDSPIFLVVQGILPLGL